MLLRKSIIAAASCALAGGAAFAQSSGQPATTQEGTVVRQQAVPTQSLQQLQEAADRLRHSIQALAQKPPGADRERALSEAHDALLRTRQAMMALPPELRTSGTVSTAGYDETVKKLMASADSLRQAIQEMAQQPAGQRRDRAIAQAHRALRDTQSALVAAYQPAAPTQSMGAASGQGDASGAGDSAGQQFSRSPTSPPGAPAAVLVLLPTAQAQGTRLADGCWVRFFDEKGFKGDTLTLAGPVDLPRMELGSAWRDWESAIVGPKATVRTFDNENFRDRTAMLRPGQNIADLGDQKLGWFEEVQSARVSCA